MRYLALLLLVSASGCLLLHDEDEDEPGWCGDGIVDGEETCDDGNRINGDGCANTCGIDQPLVVSWKLTNLAGDYVSCTPESDTAKIRVVPYAGDIAIGDEEIFIAPCTSGGISVWPTPAASYQVTVEIEWAPTRRLYAASLPIHVVDPYFPRAHAVLYSDAGYASLHWELRDAGGAEVGCGTGVAAIDSLGATFTPDGGGAPIVQQLACAPGRGISAPLPAGTYSVELGARGGSATIDGVRVDDRNRLTDTAPVVITLPL